MIICIGDSITKGSPGVSYVKYIDKNQKKRSFGLGGDTLKGLILRLDKYRDIILSNPIIIQIGTNDILLPFLYEYSHNWQKRVIKIHQRGSIPCDDINDFKVHYESMILDLINIQNKPTLINISCIGEDLNSHLNQQVDAYNLIINSIAKKYKCKLIDFNQIQKQYIQNHQTKKPYFITKNPKDMIYDVIKSYRHSWASNISQKRMLITTIDGCHLNHVGAKLLAEEINALQ